MKHRRDVLVLIFLTLAGLSILFYPTAADLWNGSHQAKTVASYTAAVSGKQSADAKDLLEKAKAWNRALSGTGSRNLDTDKSYLSQLDLSEGGVMGVLSIPKIHCSLPIFHGTGEEALRNGAGHVSWSSLPVGGSSTHCVLSGHRGLPSARLFSDLDRLEPGDAFTIRVLNETLVYEVDRIRTVLPQELEQLTITEGEDYCTLVTCTPYGVNTHRLLVRGKRVKETGFDTAVLSGDAAALTREEAAAFPACLFACAIVVCMAFRWKTYRGEQALMDLMIDRAEKKKLSLPERRLA